MGFKVHIRAQLQIVRLPYVLSASLCSAIHYAPPPQVMLESSVYLTLSVYCCCCLLSAVASCALPIETTGRGLQESSHREWGQEMMGRAAHSPEGIPRSSSGSQD